MGAELDLVWTKVFQEDKKIIKEKSPISSQLVVS